MPASNIQLLGKAYVNAALNYSLDGYLVNVEVADGSSDDGKVYADFLRYFGETLHAHNRTLGVFLDDYHSKFTPASLINALGAVDFWVTAYSPSSCTDLTNFIYGIKGDGYEQKGGGMVYTSHGDLSDGNCPTSREKG